MTVFGAIARCVKTATRPFAPVAVLGLIAALVLVLALLPWTLHAPGPIGVLVVVAVVAFAAPLRVLQHRHRLRATLGDEQRVQAELAQLWTQAAVVAERVQALDALRRPADADSRPRRLFSGLRDLRALRRALDVAHLANRARDLWWPISPPALWLTGIAALVILATAVLAPAVALISVIGLLLR